MVAGGALCGRTSNIQHRTSNIEGEAARGWCGVLEMVAGAALCGGIANIEEFGNSESCEAIWRLVEGIKTTGSGRRVAGLEASRRGDQYPQV